MSVVLLSSIYTPGQAKTSSTCVFWGITQKFMAAGDVIVTAHNIGVIYTDILGGGAGLAQHFHSLWTQSDE